MDWKGELGKLPRLQEVDLRLDALRAQRRQLRAGEPWAESARVAGARQRKLAELQGRRGDVERTQRQAEIDRQAGVEEGKRIEGRLYGGEVRNVRDLEGLQKNLAGVRQRVGDLETRILECMESGEALDKEIEAVRRSVGQAEQVLNRQRLEGGRSLAAIEDELPQLEAQRAALAAVVEPVALAEYERARARAGGVGVANLIGGSCGSCGVEVSPLVLSRLRKWERPYSCESCGRLLVEA